MSGTGEYEMPGRERFAWLASLLLHAGSLGALGLAPAAAPPPPPAPIEVALALAPPSAAPHPVAPARPRSPARPLPRPAAPPLSSPLGDETLPAPAAGPLAEAPGAAPAVAAAAASLPGAPAATAAGRAGDGGNDASLPYVLAGPPPAYPPAARAAGLSGRVRVRLLIGEDGRPQELQLAQASGVDSLDAAALAALRQWRFHPARRDGRALAAWVVVPVVFALR